jgi:hypothetical protein
VTKNSIDPETAKKLRTASRNARAWPEERDVLIRNAIAAGAGVREVARITNMAHTSILSILRKGKT